MKKLTVKTHVTAVSMIREAAIRDIAVIFLQISSKNEVHTAIRGGNSGASYED